MGTMKAIVVIDRATGNATHGACGLEEDVDSWVAKSAFNPATHEVVIVPADEYNAEYAGDVHRVQKQGNGRLRKRDKYYDELRGAEYPSIEVQLDALWHAMDAGEIPKANEFYNRLKAVKDKYPKPQE